MLVTNYPINKVSYGHLWVDGSNIWSMHDLHLAYQPHRAVLLLGDSINLATLKPQKEAPRMVWTTGLKDSSFSPLLYYPPAPNDLYEKAGSAWCCWKMSPPTFMWTKWPNDWRTIQGSLWPQGTDTETSFWGCSIVTLTCAALELADMKCDTEVTVFY